MPGITIDKIHLFGALKREHFNVGMLDFSLVCIFRDLSVDLLQMIPDNHILLAKLCAFYPGTAADIDCLHDQVSVRGVLAWSKRAWRRAFRMIVLTVVVCFHLSAVSLR